MRNTNIAGIAIGAFLAIATPAVAQVASSPFTDARANVVDQYGVTPPGTPPGTTPNTGPTTPGTGSPGSGGAFPSNTGGSGGNPGGGGALPGDAAGGGGAAPASASGVAPVSVQSPQSSSNPTKTLPFTGFQALIVALVGLLLLSLGAGLAALRRGLERRDAGRAAA